MILNLGKTLNYLHQHKMHSKLKSNLDLHYGIIYLRKGAAEHKGCVRASHPAAPSLNPGSSQIFSHQRLVCGHCEIEAIQCLSKGFRSWQLRPGISTTKNYLQSSNCRKATQSFSQVIFFDGTGTSAQLLTCLWQQQ